MSLQTAAHFGPPPRVVRESLAEDAAALHRLERRHAKVPRPMWFTDPPRWAFPTFRVRFRPFDWAHDAADCVPVPRA